MGIVQDALDLVQIEGGWRIRTTERYHVDILRMAYGNLRVVLTERAFPISYARGWCYSGQTLAAVVLRCFMFEPEAGEEPTGWVKEVDTNRRACLGYYNSTIKAHAGYEPSCPDCGNELLS